MHLCMYIYIYIYSRHDYYEFRRLEVCRRRCAVAGVSLSTLSLTARDSLFVVRWFVGA